MGDRYIITVVCPRCKTVGRDVYYAPTCGFVTWECPGCGLVVDLEAHTGISYDDASNLKVLETICKSCMS